MAREFGGPSHLEARISEHLRCEAQGHPMSRTETGGSACPCGARKEAMSEQGARLLKRGLPLAAAQQVMADLESYDGRIKGGRLT